MAGGTGRCRGIIDSGDPLVGIQVHLVDEGPVGDTVLGLVVDLDLRMVGSDMALSAGIRGARLGLGETVAAVAGGARTFAAVRVQATDTRVGPGLHRRPAVGPDLDLGAMALPAARVHRGGSTDHLTQEVVQRGEDPAGVGVVRSVHLLEFRGVALGAVLGRHDERDRLTIVVERIGIAFLGLVTIQAIDPTLAMLAVVPLLGQAR